MKLLTLNIHGVIDTKYDEKIDVFCSAILKHQPDVIALQEVMQPIANEKVDLQGEIIVLGEIPIKKGNLLLNIINRLREHNLKYHTAYVGLKKAYDYYDEGLAVLSKNEICSFELVQLSKFNEYDNYKTRFALGIRSDETWFYSVHFNWEDDSDSPFIYEWKEIENVTKSKKNIYLMGDFNLSPKSKGYDTILESYFDTYLLANEIDNGITVKGEIDGWSGKKEDKRIDYIFTKKNIAIKSSYTIFNGKNEKKISDHYGVLVEKE